MDKPTQELLDELGLVSDELVEQITDTSEATRSGWQKRKKFATRIRLGNRYFYTKASLLAEVQRLSGADEQDERGDNCLAFPVK
jgi:hypothetical protein